MLTSPIIEGDKNHITLAALIASLLASAKNAGNIPPAIHWQLNAYTNWNIIFVIARFILNIPQWDQFLCINSIGIFMGYRTAFTQGLDENIRKKLQSMKLRLSRMQFLLLDNILHTLPCVLFLAKFIQNKKCISPITSVYAAAFASWFAFRQGASLDPSKIYVPHPWKRAWLAALFGWFLTPCIVKNAIQARYKRLFLTLFILCIPYLSTKFDPNLRRKYNFEFALSKHVFAQSELRRIQTSPGSLVW